MSETYTQVAPDSTGDKIRTNELTLLQEDGTRVTVSMQVISVCDSEGNIIGLPYSPIHVDSRGLSSQIEDLAEEIRKLRQVIELNSGISF